MDRIEVERAMLRDLMLHAEATLHPFKLGKHYALDWALVRGPGLVEGWAHCVRKDTNRRDDSHVAVDMKKWLEGEACAKGTGRPFLIVCRWRDKQYYVRHDEVTDPYYGFGSRADDLEDVPCIFIPASQFHDPRSDPP